MKENGTRSLPQLPASKLINNVIHLKTNVVKGSYSCEL